MQSRSARALRQRLESLAAAGLTDLPKPRRSPRSAPAATVQATDADRPAPSSGREPGGQTAGAAGLAIIRNQVESCTRCADLAAARAHTVFGVGPPDARLCFFGEAPGADEDASGEPFVGRAGQLLTKIIEACTLRREDVYIMNVLKCRPPAGHSRRSLDRVATGPGVGEYWSMSRWVSLRHDRARDGDQHRHGRTHVPDPPALSSPVIERHGRISS